MNIFNQYPCAWADGRRQDIAKKYIMIFQNRNQHEGIIN